MHRLSLILLILLAAVSAAPAYGQTPGPTTPPVGAGGDLSGVAPLPLTGDRQAEFADYIADMLALTRVPGAAVAVVQNGEIVYQQGFGVRAMGGSEPVTPETLMMIGSVTKPMTATMAATAVDNGELTWDTPVVDLLPEFAVADPLLSERLSVRNAFCACTGLPERDPELIFNADSLTPDRLVAQAAQLPLTAHLGQQFQYSNQMFATGGYAAAAADGTESGLYDAYVAAMRDQLLTPVGMTRSTFAFTEVEASGDYAMPHGRDLSGAYHPLSLDQEEAFVSPVAPAGALW